METYYKLKDILFFLHYQKGVEYVGIEQVIYYLENEKLSPRERERLIIDEMQQWKLKPTTLTALTDGKFVSEDEVDHKENLETTNVGGSSNKDNESKPEPGCSIKSKRK